MDTLAVFAFGFTGIGAIFLWLTGRIRHPFKPLSRPTLPGAITAELIGPVFVAIGAPLLLVWLAIRLAELWR
jgi:hypothetical protein